MAATVYCTTNTAFHQHSLTTTRAQFSPVRHRTTLSTSTSFSSTPTVSHIDQPLIINTKKSDENNNNNDIFDNNDQFEDSSEESIDGIPLMINIDDHDSNTSETEHDMEDDINIDEFLLLVGLRSKTKQPSMPNLNLRPLTQRLASPVCLLPLPKYHERVRQALYIRLPFLKFLTTTTCDIELFCSTDANARAQSLLPRSTAQTRALSLLNKSPKKRKLPKEDIINMVVDTFHHNTNRILMNTPIHSALKCQVILDRLEQSTIDQIMNGSLESISTSHQLLRKTSPQIHHQLSSVTNERTTTRTTITTMRTEKMIVKRKSIATISDKSKRFKSIENENISLNNKNIPNKSTSTYQRIYLKCFLCSKRTYIDAQRTDSDVLHSHWLEHGGNLLLNIYDSEIDSILTRVVEFFKSSKQQLLEGKIKTIFILNSKEIRHTLSTANKSLSNESCIIID